VDKADIQRWLVWLLGRYSDAYASNQYRPLQQFFKWWAGEAPDPMSRLRAAGVTEKLIPVFTSVELSRLEKPVPLPITSSLPAPGRVLP
jgi:hypothetical protein